MSGYRPRGGYAPSEPRAHPSRPRDDFYDDRRSRSRSPDRRYSSPSRRRSPPYDISRVPRGPSQSYNSRTSPAWRERSLDRDGDYSARRSPSPRRGRSYYDRDRQYDDDDYDRRSRGNGRSTSPSRDRSSSRGRPSKEVMMDGLVPYLTESDISSELRQHYHVDRLEDVRIIRDKQTKQSRQFGFLRFPSLEQAEAFMDQNYPTIYLYGNSEKSSGGPDEFRVRLSYGKERRENRVEDTDWICQSCNINNYATRSRCFRCQAPRTDGPAKVVNNGDNDASPDNAPSQFLLIRGLEPSVTEELFAKGVAKLNKPSGPTTQAFTKLGKKGAKVASTTGDTNLGAKEGTLRRVLLIRDRRSNDSWRYGFAEYASIEDAQAAVTRYNSFDRFTIASKHVLVSYIHAGVFVPVLNPSPSVERLLFSPLNNPALKLAYWDEDAYVTELVVSTSGPSDADSRTSAAKTNDNDGVKGGKDMEKSIKKRKVEPSAPASTTKKPAPSHLQFWSNRHAELHGIKSSDSANGSEDGDPVKPPAQMVAPEQSFADPVRHCCYLCMRQFNSASEVNTHERVSELHRASLKNKSKLARGLAKLQKHGIAVIPVDAESAAAGEYRDRAKERRRVFGVVNKKGEQVGKKSKTVAAVSASSSDAETFAAGAAQSKGAALLSKMGYTAGQGLGVSGEGMKEAISQDVYAAGVGLGAQGGKLGDAVENAERQTKGGFKGWLDQGRDRARERYREMD